MTTFTLFVLIVFVSLMVLQFVASIDAKIPMLSLLFAIEICAFAYLASALM